MTDKITITSNMNNEEIEQLFQKNVIGKSVTPLNDLISNDKFQVTYPPDEETIKILFDLKLRRGLVAYVRMAF